MSLTAICLIISLLTVVGFVTEKLSLAVTATIALLAFYLTGCLDAESVLACFSNSTCILMVSMYIVAAGFNKTRFVKSIADGVIRAARGSLTKVMFCYIIVDILMCQFILSTFIPFCILCPLLITTVKKMGIEPRKVIYPLAIAQIVTCQALPLGAGAIVYSELNTYMTASGVAASATIMDPLISRLPVLIATAVYCIFISPKVIPGKPGNDGGDPVLAEPDQPEMSSHLTALQDAAGLVVFAAVTLGLIFSSAIGIADWVIATLGAVLMVVFGVLKPAEAVKAMPISVYLLLVGCIGMANALNVTGAGAYVGDLIAGVIGSVKSSVVFYLIVFIAPYISTQFMLNRATQLIFYPIIIQTCISLGANPIGPLLVCQQATFLAFMTPMATPVVPYFMKIGGYDLKELIRIGLLPTAIFGTVSVLWNAFMFPLF